MTLTTDTRSPSLTVAQIIDDDLEDELTPDDLPAIVEYAMSRLSRSYQLTYVHHDDKLSAEQLEEIIEGQAHDLECDLDERWEDSRYEYVYPDLIKELVPHDDAFDLLWDDMDARWEIIDEMRQRDTDPAVLTQLLDKTPRSLFAYKVAEEVDTPQSIATALGVDLLSNLDAILTLIEHNDHGGSLYILFAARPSELLAPLLDHDWQNAALPLSLSFDDPHVLMVGGTGYDEKIAGTVVVPFIRGWLDCDEATTGEGPGWNQSCGGLHIPAFETSWAYGKHDQLLSDAMGLLREVHGKVA